MLIHAGLCGQQSQSVWEEIVSTLYCYYYVSHCFMQTRDCWIVPFNYRLLGEEKTIPKARQGHGGLRAVCIKGTQWAVTSMVFGWLKASATGSRRSPWILVPASPLNRPLLLPHPADLVIELQRCILSTCYLALPHSACVWRHCLAWSMPFLCIGSTAMVEVLEMLCYEGMMMAFPHLFHLAHLVSYTIVTFTPRSL